ncbi:lipopolysaccharide core heptose(II) kinase RfaY [Vagococcus sp. WN89Y]|uniref:lipopolysaccharide core heptose(II) kinase RfaY n=1 Tax=Vagococcus sp. WN89Y TaxID=3457258 RepID=UPI003FCC5D0B
MISKCKINKYTVFTKDGDSFYLSVFQDFMKNRLKVLKIFRSIEDTKVVLIETARGPMVLKIFVPQHKKTERFLKSFFKKDYYENLIKQTDRVWKEGVTSVNDQYLLAEKKIFNYTYIYIMLIEYIQGIELERYNVVPENIKKQIHDSIIQLHKHNMVSGDPHKGNFIVTDKGIRLIDLSGKKPNGLRKAKDRLDLEKHYGIQNDIMDYSYYRFILKRKVRQWMKRVKYKIGLRKKPN